jgi:hypothetical protein
MNQFQKKIIEEVRKDEAVGSIFKRIEHEHKSKIQRFVRSAKIESDFHFTLILENYEMLEVVLKPYKELVFGMPSIEVEVEVW